MNTNTYKTTNTIRKPATASIALLITTIFLGSCTANAGYRHYDYEPATSKSIEYHYFPNAHVYYDSHRRIYHYRHQQRGWISVKKLPKYIHIDKHRQTKLGPRAWKGVFVGYAEDAVAQHMPRLQAEFDNQNTPDRNKTAPFLELDQSEIDKLPLRIQSHNSIQDLESDLNNIFLKLRN